MSESTSLVTSLAWAIQNASLLRIVFAIIALVSIDLHYATMLP